MENDDLKSQLEKARLPAFGSEMSVVPETVLGAEVSQSMENESLVRKSVPLSPTEDSLRKADANIRKGLKKGLEKEMIPAFASQEAQRTVRGDAGRSERRETERMETATAAISELSTRQAQEQVVNRVDQQGRTVQRPRLAQPRPPASPAQAIAKKGMSKALKWGLIAGVSTATATGGILGITSLFA